MNKYAVNIVLIREKSIGHCLDVVDAMSELHAKNKMLEYALTDIKYVGYKMHTILVEKVF